MAWAPQSTPAAGQRGDQGLCSVAHASATATNAILKIFQEKCPNAHATFLEDIRSLETRCRLACVRTFCLLVTLQPTKVRPRPPPTPHRRKRPGCGSPSVHWRGKAEGLLGRCGRCHRLTTILRNSGGGPSTMVPSAMRHRVRRGTENLLPGQNGVRIPFQKVEHQTGHQQQQASALSADENMATQKWAGPVAQRGRAVLGSEPWDCSKEPPRRSNQEENRSARLASREIR